MDVVEVFSYTWRYWDFRSDHYMDGDSMAVKVLVTREGFKLKEEEGRKHGSKDYGLGEVGRCLRMQSMKRGSIIPRGPKSDFGPKLGKSFLSRDTANNSICRSRAGDKTMGLPQVPEALLFPMEVLAARMPARI